jgi:hypothetical protein
MERHRPWRVRVCGVLARTLWLVVSIGGILDGERGLMTTIELTYPRAVGQLDEDFNMWRGWIELDETRTEDLGVFETAAQLSHAVDKWCEKYFAEKNGESV